MPGDAPDTQDGQPPTSPPETVQSQTSGTDTHAPHPPAHGHHPHIEYRFLDELKHRNIIRVGILYLVVCWLILDPVHVVFHMLEVPAWANRLVVILMAVGFPAVLLFAWVYEITPEGLKPTVEVAPTRSIRKQTAQRLNRAIVVVMAVALAYFVVDKFWLSTHVTTEQHKPGATAVVTDRSIAVLPFADMSEKKDQEYFADGMAEEVIDLLAKLPGLRVIGRTSSFQFKGKGADLRAIGSTLGVAYVVEGSVRKSGERLRVTVQLISTHDGSHLWSELYDAASGDVLQVQDQIATGLVRALQVTVGADDLGAPPLLKSSEAYDLYLRGRHAVDQWDRAGFEAAAGYFQQALALDPTAARTAEWLATAQLYRAIWGFVPPHEGFERARLAAQRALKLNPRSGTAHAVLASINTDYDWDWPAADRESEQALALEPRNPNVVGDAAFARSAFAQPDESVRLIIAALALDPLAGTWHELLGQMRYRAGRLAEAEAELHKALEISPTYAEAHFFLGQVLLAKGEPDAALVAMQQEVPESGRDTGLAIAYHALGRRAESDRALARQTKEHASDSAYEIAQAHAYRGEPDQAFAWLDRAYIQKDVELYWIKGDPLLKNLESDPRYKVFLRKMKLQE